MKDNFVFKMFTTCFKMFLDVILILLSYFIPKNKNLILFGAAMGRKYNGNPKYLYEYLINNKVTGIDYYWITKERDIFNKLEEKQMPALYQYSLASFLKILRAKYFIIDHFATDIFPLGEATLGRFYYINTWHGTFIKKLGKPALEYGREIAFIKFLGLNSKIQTGVKRKLYDLFIQFDEFLISTELIREKTNSHFYIKKIILSGYPRNDSLFEKNKNRFYVKYNLDKYKEIFLYAPTWRDKFIDKIPFTDDGLKEMNCYLEKTNSVLFIIKHPFDYKFAIDIAEYKNLKLVDDAFQDIYDILKFTTCLITDYSSVYFDYLLKDKPTIFYRYYHEDFLKNCRDIYKDIDALIPGPYAYTEQELISLIKTINNWFNEKGYRQKHLEAKSAFNQYDSGGFCKMFFESIELKIE